MANALPPVAQVRRKATGQRGYISFTDLVSLQKAVYKAFKIKPGMPMSIQILAGKDTVVASVCRMPLIRPMQ